jgi:hypothetical protein
MKRSRAAARPGAVTLIALWFERFAILRIKAPGRRAYYRMLFRDTLYATFAD